MNTDANIPLAELDCKEKTCPVCGHGTVSESGKTGETLYSCSEPGCVVKNAGELWFLSKKMGTSLGGALQFSLEHRAVTDIGMVERHEMPGKPEKTIPRLENFVDGIDKGILQRMEEAGMPCAGLPDNVLQSLLYVDGAWKLESGIRFVFWDGSKPVQFELPSGRAVLKSESRGCFPYKVPGTEKTIFVFQTAKEVLVARYIWKSAGLGNFPAYAVSGFPLPGTFAGTESIVFANTGKKLDADKLAEACRVYGNSIRVSDRLNIDLQGLRMLALMDPESNVKPPDPNPGLKKAGRTPDGRTVWFGEDGYHVAPKEYLAPERLTNFSFLPKSVYVSNYPASRRIMLGDVFVNGNKVGKDVPISCTATSTLNRIAVVAASLRPNEPLCGRTHSGLAAAEFDAMGAEETSFPCIPCVCRGEIVFPAFRVSDGKFLEHRHLSSLMQEQRESFDYGAMQPEPESMSDLAELAKLMTCKSVSARIVSLGICAWLYMVVTGLVRSTRGLMLPRLCFEVHGPGNEAEGPMSFLYSVFSGSPTVMNNAEFRKCRSVRLGMMKTSLRELEYEPLPGFFDIDMSTPKLPRHCMYYQTGVPALYLVRNSDLWFPINAHGNLQMAVVADGGTLEDFDPGKIRRSVLYLLSRYSKIQGTIDPDRWTAGKPEDKVRRSISNVLASRLGGTGLPDMDCSDLKLKRK